MSLLKSIARQLLGVQTAKAACPPDCWYVYSCVGGHKLRKQCCYNGDCSTVCSNPVVVGSC